MKLILQIAAGVFLGGLALTATSFLLLRGAIDQVPQIAAEVMLPSPPEATASATPDISMPPVQAEVDKYVEAERQRLETAETARGAEQRGTYTITTESGKTYSSEQPLEEYIRLEPAGTSAPPTGDARHVELERAFLGRYIPLEGCTPATTRQQALICREHYVRAREAFLASHAP